MYFWKTKNGGISSRCGGEPCTDRTLVEVPGSLPRVYREVRARVCGYLHNR